MKKLFLFGIIIFFLIFPPMIFGGEYNCKQGYPHVVKKDGTYDDRKNDLWELAQDWVFYRNQILVCNGKGDLKGVEEARRNFQKINVWLEAYSEKDSSQALSLAEDCKLKQ